MKKIKNLIYGFITLALVMTSCKKKNDEPAPVPPTTHHPEVQLSRKQLLCLAPWKFSKMKSGDMDVTDLILDPCEKDNIVTLDTAGNIFGTDEGLKCDSANEISGKWFLIENETKVVLADDTATIKELTKTSLILEVKSELPVEVSAHFIH